MFRARSAVCPSTPAAAKGRLLLVHARARRGGVARVRRRLTSRPSSLRLNHAGDQPLGDEADNSMSEVRTLLW